MTFLLSGLHMRKFRAECRIGQSQWLLISSTKLNFGVLIRCQPLLSLYWCTLWCFYTFTIASTCNISNRELRSQHVRFFTLRFIPIATCCMFLYKCSINALQEAGFCIYTITLDHQKNVLLGERGKKTKRNSYLSKCQLG